MTSKLINITDKNIEPKFETPANKTLSYLNDSIQLNKDNNELNISNQIRINGCGFLKNNKKQIMDPGHILFPNGIYETDNTFVFTVNSDIGGLVFNDLIIGNQNYKAEDQIKLWIDETDNMIGKQYVVFAEANEKVTKITETYIADNGFAVPKEVIKREWEFTFEHKLINNNINNILDYVYGSWDISKQFQLVKNKVNKYGCLWTLSDSDLEMFNNQALDGSAILRNTYKICLGVFDFNKNEGDGNYNIKNKSIIGDGFIFDGFQNNTFIGADEFSLISNDDLDTVGTYKIKEIDYGSIKESTIKVNQETLSEGIKILGNNKPHLYLKTKQDDFQYAYWTSSMEPQSFLIKDSWSSGNQLETYTDILNNIANATISDDDGGAYGYYILSAASLANIDNEHGIIFEEGDIILYNIPMTAYIQCVGYLRNDEKGGSFYPLYNENIQSIYNIFDLINEAYPEWKSTLQNFYINFTSIGDTFYFKSPSFYFLSLDNKEIKTEELYNNQLIIEDILSSSNFKYNTLTDEMGGYIKDKDDNIVGNINSSKFTGARINNCIVLWDDKIWGNDNFKDFDRLICFFNDNIIKYDSEEVEYTTIKEKEKIESKQFVGESIKTSHSNITDDGIISGVKYNLLSKDSLGGLQYDEVPTYTIGSKTKYEITLDYNVYSDTDIKVKYTDQSYNDIDFIFNKTQICTSRIQRD